MQLRLNSRSEKSLTKRKFIIKTVLFALIFFIAIFLLDKIKVSAPNKLIKQTISNDKLITLK